MNQAATLAIFLLDQCHTALALAWLTLYLLGRGQWTVLLGLRVPGFTRWIHAFLVIYAAQFPLYLIVDDNLRATISLVATCLLLYLLEHNEQRRP